MAVEAGQVVRGTVVRLMNYGVLVRIEDGSTGLVHISEIDNNFVRDVADYFQVNDPVVVKVLAFGDRGKIELSVKQAVGQAPVAIEGAVDAGGAGDNGGGGGERPAMSPSEAASARREARESFESKMSDYMRSSGERLADIKRNIEMKRGGKKVR